MSDENAEPEESEHAEPAPGETRDLTSKASAKRFKTKAAREAYEAREFWRTVFADRVGRREVWRMLEEAGAFSNRFACSPNGSPYLESTMFQAGQSALGLDFYHRWLGYARDGVNLMLDEYDPRFKPPKTRVAG